MLQEALCTPTSSTKTPGSDLSTPDNLRRALEFSSPDEPASKIARMSTLPSFSLDPGSVQKNEPLALNHEVDAEATVGQHQSVHACL